MPGLIGIIANDAGRFSLFPASVTQMSRPEGTRVEWFIGGDWCAARNNLVRLALSDDAEWLWFMDDDHAFPHDILLKLLRWDVPLVMPICLSRLAPFWPVQFTERVDHNHYLPIPLRGMDTTNGLVKLEGGGCAGMLIRREVLEAVDEPWFEYTDRSEDLVFCEKAKAAGFEIYGDLEARLGHITTTVIWPTVKDEQWQVGLTVGRDMQLTVPFAAMTETEVEEDAVA